MDFERFCAFCGYKNKANFLVLSTAYCIVEIKKASCLYDARGFGFFEILLKTSGFFQLFGHVCLFPCEIGAGSSKVAAMRSLSKNRPGEFQVTDHLFRC